MNRNLKPVIQFALNCWQSWTAGNDCQQVVYDCHWFNADTIFFFSYACHLP